jgi:hypothetical protein
MAKDFSTIHPPRRFPLWPGLLTGALFALVLSAARLLPFVAEHLPEALLHPLFLAGAGLFLAGIVTLCGDGRRLWISARELRALGRDDHPTWARDALVADLLAVDFPGRFRSLPAAPGQAEKIEAEIDADCAWEFHTRQQLWTACLRRRWLYYWVLGCLILPPIVVLTVLQFHGGASAAVSLDAFVPLRDNRFLPLEVATLQTATVCLLALGLHWGWRRLLKAWRKQASQREVQLSLFPELVLPSPPHVLAEPESVAPAVSEAPAVTEGGAVSVVEWGDFVIDEPGAAPADSGNPPPTTLAAGKPTVMASDTEPPSRRTPPKTEPPLRGDLQLVEEDEA